MTLQKLMKNERAAWKALMNDPAVIADPKALHTPALREAWERAADAERAFREEHGLIGVDRYGRGA